MKIAAEISAEIGENRFASAVETLCVFGCDIGSVQLVRKNESRSVYDFHFTYSDSAAFRKAMSFFDDEQNDCRILSVRNYLDEMVSQGLISITGRMKIENVEDYQMHVLGVSHLVREKILESDNPREISGIGRSIALVSGVRNKSDRMNRIANLLHADGEIAAAVLGKFGQLNGYPLVLQYDLQEDFLKYLKALEPGFSGFRIESVDDDDNPAIHEQVADELSVPVVSMKFDEMPVFILAAIHKIAKKHKFRTKDCNIGFIGLDVSAMRLARLLKKAGYLRVLGFDNNEKNMFQFERESGLATSPENILSNVEIVVLLKNQFSETDLVRMRPGLSVVSLLSDPDAENIFAQKKGCGDIIAGEWVDPAIIYPGILRGKAGSSTAGISDETILALAEMLALEETAGSDFLPDIFSRIDERVEECVRKSE